jgi:hypothetical protein
VAARSGAEHRQKNDAIVKAPRLVQLNREASISVSLPGRDVAANKPEGSFLDGFQMAGGWMRAGLMRPGRF